jgi:hypothetical protein
MSEVILTDKKYIPIREGDLVKVFHFIGARKKKYFMYKLIHKIDGRWYGAHVHKIPELGLSLNNSYALPRSSTHLEDYEIVDGYHGEHFEERRKLKPQPPKQRGE